MIGDLIVVGAVEAAGDDSGSVVADNPVSIVDVVVEAETWLKSAEVSERAGIVTESETEPVPVTGSVPVTESAAAAETVQTA